MHKKMMELKEELEREKSLRGSLEESHNTLLSRIGEMETIVESEREEVNIYQSLFNLFQFRKMNCFHDQERFMVCHKSCFCKQKLLRKNNTTVHCLKIPLIPQNTSCCP